MKHNKTNKTDKNISRRNFLKIIGATAGATALAGCGVKSSEPDNSAADKIATTSANVPKSGMTMRVNPTTGDEVSLLGYGCMRLPTIEGVSARENDSEIDQQQVNRLVDYAIEHGVNLFDTSPAYCKGMSEKAMGIALSRHPRDKYFLSTKLSNFAPQTWSYQESVKMYRNSMKELKTDYLDYYLLHAIGGKGDEGRKAIHQRYLDNGMLDFLIKERSAGRIRNLGFSFHGEPDIFDWLLSMHKDVHWDFVLIQMNYLDWKNSGAEYLYRRLEELSIPALVMEPLLGGRLVKLPDAVVAKLKQREPNRSVASWAFRFAGTPKGILSVLSGMTYMEHLQDNLRTYMPLKPISDDEHQFLMETAEMIVKYPTIPCNDCKYCMPCPYGIDIPSILLHYNKCVNEGNVTASSNDPRYAEARRAFLVGYDRAVEKLRQADHCVGCGKCMTHCPQQIDIPAELIRIDDYIEKLKQKTNF